MVEFRTLLVLHGDSVQQEVCREVRDARLVVGPGGDNLRDIPQIGIDGLGGGTQERS